MTVKTLSFTGLILIIILLVFSFSCQGKNDPNVNMNQSTADSTSPEPENTNTPQTGKILLVHSYHTGYPWVDAITRGVNMALSGSDMELEIYYMDTKRRTEDEWKIESGQNAKGVVDEWKPDVVITSDDNAQIFFARDYAGMDTLQFVFCGVNAEPEDYGYPASNVTGILERPHFIACLDLLSQLMPDAKRIAIISDDSETSDGALKYMQVGDSGFELVSTDRPSTFDEWQEAVLRVQDTSDAIAIYMYHTVKREGQAESMDPKDVMTWTIENSSIPVIGFFIFTVDDGAICGYVESGVEHGFKAAEIALQMLNGVSASEIPIVTALEGQSMVNLDTARSLGITVSEELRGSVDIVRGE